MIYIMLSGIYAVVTKDICSMKKKVLFSKKKH